MAAIEIAEDMRTKVASPDLRAQLLDKVSNIYRLGAEVLMRMGQTREAFSFTERGRAPALLDLLATGSPSLTEERKVRTTRNAKAGRLTRLLARQAGASETEPLRREIAGLLDAHAALKERIAREDPRFARESAPATIEEIQEHISPGEAILEFSLGEQSSYLWIVKRDALDGFALPPRAQIERVAASLRPGHCGSTARIGGRVERASARSGEGGARRQELYLVLDGELQYVPFASLGPLRNLEIVTLPSAAFLARLPERGPSSKSVAVFADPVYEISDARFHQPVEAAEAKVRAGLRASEASFRFPRLRFSGQEANAIASLTGPRAIHLATGFAATREAALAACTSDLGGIMRRPDPSGAPRSPRSVR